MAAAAAAGDTSGAEVKETVDPWQKERQGVFFLEWRVRSLDLIEQFATLQRRCQEWGGDDVQVLQSAGADNMHITLNEMRLKDGAELERLEKVLCAYAASRDTEDSSKVVQGLAAAVPAATDVQVRGISDFNQRVLFISCAGEELPALFNSLQSRLTEEGFAPKSRPGPFVPHLTICKAHPRAKKLPAALFEKLDEKLEGGRESYRLGKAPLNEFVLCCKRLREEPTPPVLLTIPIE